MIKAIANSDAYKELDKELEQVADKLAKDPKFAEQVKADAETLKASGFKSKVKGTSQ